LNGSIRDSTVLPTDADRRDIEWAIAQAQRNDTDLDPSVFAFLHRLLAADLVAKPRSGFSRHSVVRLAMWVQQYSGPVMAKGLEDTAFYRYNRFVALNEVGGHPDHFGVSLTVSTKSMRSARPIGRTLCWALPPMTPSEGEDTRARLAVLSEIPEEWGRQVEAWSRILRARRGDVEGSAPPDRNDEYLFYQLLLGAWPAELTGIGMPDAAALRSFGERMKAQW
jgi:(1->4)-alpha-D-glucan 1-alpha-D-glucosylmutase